jgi:hypothetical protein
MTTVYPASIDSNVTLPLAVDNKTPVRAVTVNQLQQAILAIEAALGVQPGTTYGTVRARLDYIQMTLAPTNPVTLGGDLGNTTTDPYVIGLQGRPLANLAPTPGQVIAWNGSVWIPTTLPPPSPSTPTGPAGGNLSGNYPNPVVAKIQNTPVSATAPSIIGQSLLWNGSAWYPGQLTQDQILPSFQISLSGGGLVEAGATVTHPAFTATYTTTPTSAVLTDSVPNASQNVISSPTSFSSANNYTYNSYGQSVTFTLTSGNGIVTRTANATFFWAEYNYYGVGPAGQSSAIFITTMLSGRFLATARGTIFTSPNAGPFQKVYYAHRVGFGVAMPTNFIVGGFAGGFTATNTNVSVTNDHGVVDTYVIYESDNLGLGVITVTVT